MSPKLKTPPTSSRYCLLCERYREFRYDRMIGHSRCIRCTSTCSRRFSPADRHKRYCIRNNMPYSNPVKIVKEIKDTRGKKHINKNKESTEKKYSLRYLEEWEKRKEASRIKNLKSS